MKFTRKPRALISTSVRAAGFSSLVSSTLLGIGALYGCGGDWEGVRTPPGGTGYVYECWDSCPCLPSDTSPTCADGRYEYRTGVVCADGMTPAEQELSAINICDSGSPAVPDYTCTEGGFIDSIMLGCTRSVVPVTPYTNPVGAIDRCVGPCSPGPLEISSSTFAIELDPALSAIVLTDAAGNSYPPMSVGGQVHINGGDCPGATCPVRLDGMSLHSTGSISVDGVQVTNPQLYLLRRPETTIEAGGGMGFLPGQLVFSLAVDADNSAERTVFKKLNNYSYASVIFDAATSEFIVSTSLTDAVGNSAFVALYGTVQNRAPVAAFTGTLAGHECGGQVTVDATTTTDPDGPEEIAQLMWVRNEGAADEEVLGSGAQLVATLPPGEQRVTLVASDVHGARGRATQTFNVSASTDTTPPVVDDTSLQVSCIWSPNHKYVPLAVGEDFMVGASDNCGDVQVEIVSASSEPDNANGDGDTTEDLVVGSDGICVRAERKGSGDGRTYFVTVRATDDAGNVSEETLELVVPHDRSEGGAECRRGTVDECPFEPLDEAPDGSSCTAASGTPTALFPALVVLGLAIYRRRRRNHAS